jgi:hypothetical protein
MCLTKFRAFSKMIRTIRMPKRILIKVLVQLTWIIYPTFIFKKDNRI